MTREEAIQCIKHELLITVNRKDLIGQAIGEALGMAIEALSADSVQEWIPCGERLPEEFYVLCCDSYGGMLIANPFECDDSDTGFSAESDECYMYNCIAWMPLPKPYKGGDSE